MRFLLIMLLCLLVFNRFGDWMTRHGFGRLPGDLRWRIAGREFFLPLGSGVVLMLIAFAIAWLK
ncbi:MAG: DUF2905 domain-containing protein [Burkholderiaceae bacterium]|jgi:hypothetical protein